MSGEKNGLIELVNKSGFAFQLRVAREAGPFTSSRRIFWEPVATEHRWFDQLRQEERFIDLIVQGGAFRLVVECKRVTDGNWVFLVPDGGTSNQFKARLLWTTTEASDWHDFHVLPHGPESAFCVVRGQGENDQPMLERLASLLMRSVESLAEKELGLHGRREGSPNIYVPVIVTNASLFTCAFDDMSTDLETGRINEARIEPVEWVHFRKNLSSGGIEGSRRPGSLQEANNLCDRTIFVVNAIALRSFLDALDVPNDLVNAPWPW